MSFPLQPPDQPPKPLLFLYSLILPLYWLVAGMTMNAVTPGKRAGIPGTMVVVACAGISTGWLFVRKYRRHFTTAERWWLIGFCMIWALLLESAALAYAASVGIIDPAKVGILVFAVCFAFVLDTLLIWLSYKYSARRVMTAWLEKHVPAPPPLPPDLPK